MRLHPYIRKPLVTSARNAAIYCTLLTLAGLYVVISTQFLPEYALFRVWWPVAIVVGLVTLFMIAVTWESFGEWRDPMKHKALVRLGRDGDLEARLGAVVAELDGPREQHGAMTFTANHAILEDGINYAILPIEWIVLAWATEREKRKYGVTVNSTYTVTLALRGGEKITFDSSGEHHENVLLCIAQRPGNHVVGYDENVEKQWNDKEAGHESVTRAVDWLASQGRLGEGPAGIQASLMARVRDARERAHEVLAMSEKQIAELRAQAKQ